MKNFPNVLGKIPKIWLNKITHNLSIGQKIRYGYALILSIAVVGTVGGFLIGDYYEKPARLQQQDADYEINLLHRLQTAVLQTRSSQEQFISLLGKPELLKHEYSEFSTYANELKKVWAETESYANSENYKLEQHAEGIPGFLQTYRSVPEEYLQQVEEIVQRIDVEHLKPQDVEPAQQLLLKFNLTPLLVKYEQIDNDLTDVINHSYQDDREADALLIKVDNIGSQIIVASILFSVIFATFIAIYTSHILTAPIIALTNIALRTAKELKFDILVPVMTTDEIGVLANSFNSLIKRLAEYTNELEIARHTLESRVEERTQELSKTLNSLQQTQSQLIQAEKMSALGQLVAGIAHEINNPVNFIHGNLTYINNYTADLLSLIDLYQQRYFLTDPEIADRTEEIELDFIVEDLPKILKSMKAGTDRIREIVLSLRNFSRLDEADMKIVNIHEGIDSTLLILQHRIKSKPESPAIEIVKKYGNLPKVECYAGQINQVLMNIISNAIDALQEQDRKRSPEEIKNNPSTIKIHTEILNNCTVRISIKDNGIGMMPNVKTRIFHPFFTTKPVGEGTGLGLSISYKIIIDNHKGSLICLSELGQGSEFQIEIPISQTFACVK